MWCFHSRILLRTTFWWLFFNNNPDFFQWVVYGLKYFFFLNMYLKKGNNRWLQWGKGTWGLNVSHFVFFMRRMRYILWPLNISFVKMCRASALISWLFNQQHTVMHRIVWLGVSQWASLNILCKGSWNTLSHICAPVPHHRTMMWEWTVFLWMM